MAGSVSRNSLPPFPSPALAGLTFLQLFGICCFAFAALCLLFHRFALLRALSLSLSASPTILLAVNSVVPSLVSLSPVCFPSPTVLFFSSLLSLFLLLSVYPYIYNMTSPPFVDYVSLYSSFPTSVSLADDQMSAYVYLPFAFPYFDNTYSSLLVPTRLSSLFISFSALSLFVLSVLAVLTD
jgi:hypothetical protein